MALSLASEPLLTNQTKLRSPGANLASIAEIVEEVSFFAGEILFHQGDPGDFMYLIREGKLSIEVEGRQVALAGPPQCVGDMALIDGLPRSADVVVRENARLVRISSQNFRKLLVVRPEISLALMRTIAARLREAESQ